MNPLSEHVQNVMDRTTESDPRVIAATVLKEIPDNKLREALGVALVAYVSRMVTRQRRGVPLPRYAPRPTVPSHKVAAVRSEWAKFLAERVQVHGTWKTVADCTVTDVEVLASDRRETAEKNLAHAKRFEDLAMRMKAQGAATVRDFNPA